VELFDHKDGARLPNFCGDFEAAFLIGGVAVQQQRDQRQSRWAIARAILGEPCDIVQAG
jgi:hypothetical protein